MKVHRIITTIEVENDNSITSVEVTNLYPDNADIPLAVTNITTNGSANNINKVYAVVDKLRIVINGELKSIARCINTILTQSGVRGESPIEPDGTSDTSSIGISDASQVLRISSTNLARHDDNLNDVRHDETNGDRTSDY